jgi:hypothetical protein
VLVIHQDHKKEEIVMDTVVKARTTAYLGSGLFNILAYLALSLYGMAMLQRSTSGGVGWVFLVGGLCGIVLHLVGGTLPAFVYCGTGALGVTAWLQRSHFETAV